MWVWQRGAERKRRRGDTIGLWELGRGRQGDGWRRSRTSCRRLGFGLERLTLRRTRPALMIKPLALYEVPTPAPTLNYRPRLIPATVMSTAIVWRTGLSPSLLTNSVRRKLMDCSAHSGPSCLTARVCRGTLPLLLARPTTASAHPRERYLCQQGL